MPTCPIMEGSLSQIECLIGFIKPKYTPYTPHISPLGPSPSPPPSPRPHPPPRARPWARAHGPGPLGPGPCLRHIYGRYWGYWRILGEVLGGYWGYWVPFQEIRSGPFQESVPFRSKKSVPFHNPMWKTVPFRSLYIPDRGVYNNWEPAGYANNLQPTGMTRIHVSNENKNI